jgi:ribosomal-protein-alanine N-acetyltransferase
MLGYWIGKEQWGRGFCPEATRDGITFGYQQLQLNNIYAYHLAANPAFGKVIVNAAMVQEGYFHNHVITAEKVHDCVFYGITVEDLKPIALLL